jgi:hypothetical protein
MAAQVASTVIGGAVSSAVYTAVQTTGELSGAGMGHGLRLGGSMVGAAVDWAFGGGGSVVATAGSISGDLVRPALNKATIIAAGTTAAAVGGAAGLLAYGTITGLEYVVKGLYDYGKGLLNWEPLEENTISKVEKDE